MTNPRRRFLIALLTCTIAWGWFPGSSAACIGSPIILDLSGSGTITTDSLENPVRFDLTGDHEEELTAWTAAWSGDAFLWLDLNGNDRADGGTELFGDATILPWGEPAEHGFAALAVYDTAKSGGNSDGILSADDEVWIFLRLWEDRSHDGTSQPDEISTLADHDIVAIGLEFAESKQRDGNGNYHRFVGSFVTRATVIDDLTALKQHLMEDVFFQYDPGYGRSRW